jgi:hypothetical protein
LARDEANQPLAIMEPVLGLRGRNEPQIWYQVQLYGGTGLESYSDRRYRLAPVPPGAKILGGSLAEGSFDPVIGRETLTPDGDAEVLARFADGSPAALRHRHGKGRAYVLGFFPGLEYSATVRSAEYDMRRDFQSARRKLVAAPALELTAPVVDPSDPLVEGVLLRCAAGQRRAVTLANWAYAAGASREDSPPRQNPVLSHLSVENLKVTIRGAGKVSGATSCMLERRLELTTSGETVTVTLPRLEEGDVLLLE